MLEHPVRNVLLAIGLVVFAGIAAAINVPFRDALIWGFVISVTMVVVPQTLTSLARRFGARLEPHDNREATRNVELPR